MDRGETYRPIQKLYGTCIYPVLIVKRRIIIIEALIMYDVNRKPHLTSTADRSKKNINIVNPQHFQRYRRSVLGSTVHLQVDNALP